MVKRLITLREYETLRVSDTLVAAGEQALTYKEAEELLRFDESLAVRAFEHRYRGVRFLNYCGVIQVGQLTIEILPKIAEPTTDGRDSLDRQLLLRMLAVARDLPLIDACHANIQLQKHHLLDIVVAYFCDETFRQFHKGLIRRYETIQESLPLIRGRWLIEADVRLSVGRKDQAHCEFDNFTDDNPYNQAIKATLRLLAKHTAPNAQLNQKVRALAALLPDVTLRSFTSEAVHALPRNRLVSRYETVLRLCEWFLAGQSPNVHAGQERALGLLFDMNVLFEEFVAKTLRSVLPEGYQLKTQGPRAYLAREQVTGDKRFQMKPDICVIQPSGDIGAIIDTKWKLLDASDATHKYGVQQADMYQLRTYAESYNSSKVALWYPASLQAKQNMLVTFDFQNFGGEATGKTISVSTIDLMRFSNSSKTWQIGIANQIESLIVNLCRISSGVQRAA
jgi:5-methylcytosine-specific restriction enzyme subunit McrC